MNHRRSALRLSILVSMLGLFSLVLAFCFLVSRASALNFRVTDVSVSEVGGSLSMNDVGIDIASLAVQPDMVFEEVGDYVTYKVNIQNQETKRLRISDISDDNETKYVTTEYSYDNGTQSQKALAAYITLKNEKKPNVADPDLGTFTTTIRLTNRPAEGEIDNPQTGDEIFIYFGVLGAVLVLGAACFFLVKNRRTGKTGIMMLMLIPAISGFVALSSMASSTFAQESDAEVKVTFSLEKTDITVVTTMFNPGRDVNIAMKKFANPNIPSTANSSETERYDNYHIIGIVRSNTLNDGLTSDNIVSTPESEVPIYMWYVEEDQENQQGNIYYYTEADVISLNSDSLALFRNMPSLKKIDSVSSWDTSSVTIMGHMFYSLINLTSLDGLENWDTSSVTNMGNMFNGAHRLADIDALANWNTSSVVYMNSLFNNAYLLNNIDVLANWNTSNVTSMGYMFGRAESLTDLSPLEGWDVSNANTSAMFFAIPDSVVRPSWY